MTTTPVNFPVLLDRDRAVAKQWKVDSLPSTFVLDANLRPRLAVESDFAWDRLNPQRLIEFLNTNAPHSDAVEALTQTP